MKEPFPETSCFQTGHEYGEERVDHRFAVETQYLQPLGEGGLLPLRLFLHGELLQSVPHAPVIKQKELIQTLHYLHFSNAPVLVLFTDPIHEENFLIQSHLESCTAGEIRCRWPQEAIPVPDDVWVQDLIVDDGLSLVLLPIRVIDLYEDGFSAAIPEEGRLLGKRRVRRHVCRGIDVVLIQNGFVARGELIDFSPMAFRVRVHPDTNSSFIWMITDSQCAISLYANEKYSSPDPAAAYVKTGVCPRKNSSSHPSEKKYNVFRRGKRDPPVCGSHRRFSPILHILLFKNRFRETSIICHSQAFPWKRRGKKGFL